MDVPRGEGNSGGRILQSAPPPQCEIDVGVMISLRRYSEVLEAEQARAQESFLRHSWSGSTSSVEPRRECGLPRAVFVGRYRSPVESRSNGGNRKRRFYPTGMLRAIPTTCQHGGLGALSKWQCQGGHRCETENKLDWNPTYSYWNLLKLE